MAQTHTTQNSPSLIEVATTFFTETSARFSQYRKRRAAYHRTFNELSQLSDADLNDLGISRYGIHFIAKDAANAL